MSFRRIITITFGVALLLARTSSASLQQCSSPDGRVVLYFKLNNGAPYYSVTYGGQNIITDSRLGFRLQGAPPLEGNFKVAAVQQNTADESWIQPWGEVEKVRNHYHELTVSLVETTSLRRTMKIIARVFNDGLGLRYELPTQPHLNQLVITDELTEFNFTGDHLCWWIKAYQWNRYEYLYRSSRLTAIDTVHTPLTMQTDDGLVLSVHEAGLDDYASMTLARREGTHLKCDLVPWSDGTKVKRSTPLRTPWRTLQIARKAGDLIESNLILNLNEPCRLQDIAWIKPGKYIGIWWGMHLGKYTWGSGPRHGATTENAKRYIDFAAQHGFSGVLVEGWNTGWDGDWVKNGALFNFTRAHPDFDIAEVARYAAQKGVQLIGHHETGADVINYERQLDDAFRFYQKLGIHMVKTGYVGHGRNIRRLDQNGQVQREWHHGQFMVRHYRKVIETAAKYQIMLDVHEPIKDTGERRTFPNMMTREGARGMEYDAWSPDGGNPLDYLTILPFTRLLGGPMDFTPGILDLCYEEYQPHNRVNTTLAKMLSYYVIIYSPLQMAADLIENYANQPAFKFICDVPVDWRTTRVLHAQIGDYLTVVRQDRHSPDWYLGSLTDENPRLLSAQLDFLPDNTTYVAEIYADAPDADWRDNPLALAISQALVERTTMFQIRLAPGGGCAVRFRPTDQHDLQQIPRY